MHGPLTEQITRNSRPRHRRAVLFPVACLLAMLVAGTAQASHDAPRPPRRPNTPGLITPPATYHVPHQPKKGRKHGKAQKQFQRGYSAGQVAGWQAGMRDGRRFRPFCPTPPACDVGRGPHFMRGFHAGYSSAYTAAYRQAQRTRCGTGHRRGSRQSRHWRWGWNW